MNHEHNHNHTEGDNESSALLKYYADHNAHHAEELRELESRLPENVAAFVREAVSLMNASTEKLRAAIRETEG